LALCDQPVFTALGRSATVPVSRRVAGRVLSLPMHPYLDTEDQKKIVAAVNAACA